MIDTPKAQENSQYVLAALLATGSMDIEIPPAGWRAVDLGLRSEIIAAALRSPQIGEIHNALLKRQPIQFRDEDLEIVMRWSP